MKKLSLIVSCLSIINICWSQSIYDNFDNYKAGEYLGIESNGLWTTWNNSPGGSEDVIISNEHSYSSDNSIKLQSGNSTDVVLPLGDQTSGKWVLSYMMRIESGYGAYFNLLHEFDSEASNWAVQVYFSQAGFGYLTVGSGVVNSNFTHPVGSWFEVKVDVDIDNNLAFLILDENFIFSWVWSEGSMNQAASPSTKLAALDLFPAASGEEDALYYVDNVSFSEYEIGLSELENETSVYPNPATNSFSVKNIKNAEIQVFNLLGSEVLSFQTTKDEHIINCSGWKSGLYFMQITKKDGAVQQSKLIIE
jgi:hypothetical protein